MATLSGHNTFESDAGGTYVFSTGGCGQAFRVYKAGTRKVITEIPVHDEHDRRRSIEDLIDIADTAIISMLRQRNEASDRRVREDAIRRQARQERQADERIAAEMAKVKVLGDDELDDSPVEEETVAPVLGTVVKTPVKV